MLSCHKLPLVVGANYARSPYHEKQTNKEKHGPNKAPFKASERQPRELKNGCLSLRDQQEALPKTKWFQLQKHFSNVTFSYIFGCLDEPQLPTKAVSCFVLAILQFLAILHAYRTKSRTKMNLLMRAPETYGSSGLKQ